MTAEVLETPAATRAGGFGRLRSILTGSAGNLVEVYDWFVYAAFALYFARSFFPHGDQTAQLLNTAAVFGVAGRKAAMVASVSLMCFGSLVIGLCPGFATIGAAAPVVLVLARILQGASLGGEYGTSAVYMSEMAGRTHRGLWSGVFYSTLIAGQLLAMATLLILQATLSDAELAAWGWRIPFFLGGALALTVFWLRRGMAETPSFQARGAVRATTWGLMASHPRESLIVMGLTAGGTLGYYTFTTYIQKFLVNTSGFSKDAASLMTAGGLVQPG
jgi:MHS family alpha-ketoglutarate permease-like MFS transporter